MTGIKLCFMEPKPATCQICGVAEWGHACLGPKHAEMVSAPPKAKFDKTAYQREYMRARRAKKKKCYDH